MNTIGMSMAARGVGSSFAGGGPGQNPQAKLNKIINANKESHKAVAISHLGGMQLTHELGGQSPPARNDNSLLFG